VPPVRGCRAAPWGVDGVADADGGRDGLDLFPAPDLVVAFLDCLDHRRRALGLNAGDLRDVGLLDSAGLSEFAEALVQRRGVAGVADGEDDAVGVGVVVGDELLHELQADGLLALQAEGFSEFRRYASPRDARSWTMSRHWSKLPSTSRMRAPWSDAWATFPAATFPAGSRTSVSRSARGAVGREGGGGVARRRAGQPTHARFPGRPGRPRSSRGP